MHRWFRICGRFALVRAAAAAPLLALSTYAEEPASSPETKEVPAPAPAPAIPLPTPGKHQLKVTPLQVVQHQAEVLAQKLETQGSLLVSLTQQIEEQKKEIETLKEQNETLATNLTVLEGQFSNLSDTVEEMSAEREGTPLATAPSTSITPPKATRLASPATSDDFSLPGETEEELPPASGVTHVVERGENLTVIARKYGTTAGDLLRLNRIRDERKLQIGQELMIPAGEHPATPPTSQNRQVNTP